MDWITTIVNAITQLSTVAKERLVVLIVVGLFVFGLYSQYQTIQEKEAKITQHEKNCSELISKIREDNRISYNSQTILFQNQINEFVLKKNHENDSVYTYFFDLIRKYNFKITKINSELDKLKANEVIN
jgi:hypothetical protein